MTIQETETKKLADILKSKGFEAKLYNSYDNEYNQDYNHLSIMIENAENKLDELYNLARGFEIKLAKWVHKEKCFFEIRQNRKFAELIKQQGVNYNLLNKRETTPLDDCIILKYSDWTNYYNEIA